MADYVTTGAPVPPGYITVVPIENIDKDISEAGTTIRIKSGTPPV